MLKATIAGFVYPASRRVNESVDCVISIRNDGDEEGWFMASVAFWTGSDWLYYYAEWVDVLPGATVQFPVSFVMPQGDATIWPMAGFWDWAAQAAIWEPGPNQVTITLAGAVTQGPAQAVIVNYQAPASARSGDKVIVTATLRNDGERWAFCRLALAYLDAGSERWAYVNWEGLFPGDSVMVTLEFPMPAASTNLVIYAQHWDFDQGLGINDGSTGILTVALDASEWLHLELPAAIVSALDTGWANITAGEWADIFGFKIPPITFEPGRWALKGLNWIVDGVNWVVNKGKETWDKAYEAYRRAGESLTKINDWLLGAYNWFTSRVSDWWDSTWPWVNNNIVARIRPVWDFANQLVGDITRVQGNVDGLGDSTRGWQSWLLGSLAQIPPIDVLIQGYNKAENFYRVYLTQIDDFFLNPMDWVFDKLDNWLNERVS